MEDDPLEPRVSALTRTKKGQSTDDSSGMMAESAFSARAPWPSSRRPGPPTCRVECGDNAQAVSSAVLIVCAYVHLHMCERWRSAGKVAKATEIIRRSRQSSQGRKTLPQQAGWECAESELVADSEAAAYTLVHT